MKTITYSALVQILANGGAQPVGINAVTDAKARKTGVITGDHGESKIPNPFGTILKTVRAVGFVGANYESSVQREGVARQQEGEADAFKADSLPWGQWVIPNKVIGHKGALYLRTQSTPGQRSRQPARVLAYSSTDGAKLSKDQVAPFLPPDSESAKQSAVGMEGKERQVMVRTYRFDSIKTLRIGGHSYKLVPDDGHEPAPVKSKPAKRPSGWHKSIGKLIVNRLKEQVQAIHGGEPMTSVDDTDLDDLTYDVSGQDGAV